MTALLSNKQVGIVYYVLLVNRNITINYVVDKESTYQNIIMAKDSISSSESCFTFGNEQVSVETNGNISYYRTDEQGSITQILSKTGTVQADIRYDEYRVIINPEDVNINGNIFAYTGHVYDESTSLTYAKARFMMPEQDGLLVRIVIVER